MQKGRWEINQDDNWIKIEHEEITNNASTRWCDEVKIMNITGFRDTEKIAMETYGRVYTGWRLWQ